MITSNSTRKKRPKQWTSGDWWFRQDNAPYHRAILVAPYMADRGMKLVQNSTYNPDLPPCDFFFLFNMKCSMKGTRTGNEGEIAKVPEGGAAEGLVEGLSGVGEMPA